MYPEADLFCLVDFIGEKERGFLTGKTAKTSFIQKLPGARKQYRSYLPLMPLAIEQLDVSEYNLVISSSHAIAKGIITGPDQLHISYVHSPIRYAWDLQNQYLEEANMTSGAKSWLARIILHYMRLWDYRTANGVDFFIANSDFIAKRIHKVYRRDADIIYPPVDLDNFGLCEQKEEYYLAASRQVPYKKVRLIVEAFNRMPEKKLLVIGDGPEFANIKKCAGPNIQMLGYQPDESLRQYMQRAKAFVFAAKEDFGIMPVEAQACGTPVIAFGEGGVRETVLPLGDNCEEPATGVFFQRQRVEDIIEAVQYFEQNQNKLTPAACRNNAMRFSNEIFCKKFKQYVEDKMESSGI